MEVISENLVASCGHVCTTHMNKLFSADEAADRLRVHRMTISRWVVRGLLHPKRGRRKQEFTEAELLRFLEEEGSSDCYWWRQEGDTR